MIKLESSPTPQVLALLSRFEAERARSAANGTPLRSAVVAGYRHPEVKSALIAETYGKCAYCESKITHVYWGDVEHIIPKSLFPDRMFDYNNLTISCAICNNNKDNYYSATALILDPYRDNPDEHLVALGQLVWHRNGSHIGQRTILLLQLNRDGLLERRYEQLQRISGVADQFVREPEGPVRRLLLEQICEMAGPDAEFSLVVRTFLRVTYGLECGERVLDPDRRAVP